MELKACSRCKIYRLPSEYSGNKYGKDGLHWVCSRCLNEIYVRRQKKVKCECGNAVSESYLNKHIHTGLHLRNLQNRVSYEYMKSIAVN